MIPRVSFVLTDDIRDSLPRNITRRMSRKYMYNQILYLALESQLVSYAASAWPVSCSHTCWQEVPNGDEAENNPVKQKCHNQYYGLFRPFCIP